MIGSVVRLVFILMLLGGIGVVVAKTLRVPAEHVHFHANFLVVKNGEVLDFSGPEFMEIEPCTDDESTTHTESKTERVHLHDANGGTAHVHAPFVTWKELFNYLKLEVPEDMQYILNGAETSNIPYREMHDKDRLLVILGGKPQNLQEFVDRVPDDAEQYDNAAVGTESCGGSKNETLTFFERFRIAFKL